MSIHPRPSLTSDLNTQGTNSRPGRDPHKHSEFTYDNRRSLNPTASMTTAALHPITPSASITHTNPHLTPVITGDISYRYFLPDALSTVRDIVDEDGDVIQSYEFQEHGPPMPSSGASSGTFSPKTYQGGLSVNDDRNNSGLYLMGHRHFAADLGRFISRDPIGFQGGLNLFNGAGNSPVDTVDPSGLIPGPEGMGSYWYNALYSKEALGSSVPVIVELTMANIAQKTGINILVNEGLASTIGAATARSFRLAPKGVPNPGLMRVLGPSVATGLGAYTITRNLDCYFAQQRLRSKIKSLAGEPCLERLAKENPEQFMAHVYETNEYVEMVITCSGPSIVRGQRQ